MVITSRFKPMLALPPYSGGKRRLISKIFRLLESAVPASEWPTLHFMDAFVGGGVVSLAAKALGFKALHCNDWSERSQIVIQALIENQSRIFSSSELLALTRPLETPGFVQTHYAPSVFSTRHAIALDRILYNAQQLQNPTQRSLALLLAWRIFRSSHSADRC